MLDFQIQVWSSGAGTGAVETYKQPLEALHDSVSHALQPPKPTITACMREKK